MCGIMGMVGCSGEERRAHICAMAQQLAHRGPDDFGIFLDDQAGVALAHHRLSILDLSSNGHQPMTSADGRWTITFNGEIYNYRELRDELAEQGAAFTSTSDTEVLLKGYQAWGPAVLDRLVGMFAFAIWDGREKSLFLARDRVGKKPLIYCLDDQILTFASELKALHAVPSCRRRLNADAVDAYLALGYVPAPLTIFQNIHKLPPGHSLHWQNGRSEVRRYWLPEAAEGGSAVGNNPAERFRELFREAVRLRLRSDVPVGLFLSGGIDSSAIAAECAEIGHEINAFTVVFDRDAIDLPYAQAVARRFGMRHEVVEAVGSELSGDLEKINWFYDEPFADSSNIACYYIARHTHGRFKVILTGDGGDEAFAGYPHYEFIALKQLLKRWAAAAGLKDGSLFRPLSTYFQSKALFQRSLRDRLFEGQSKRESGFAGYLNNEPFLRTGPRSSTLHQALWADRHIYLPNDLLYKMDIALMSHGIEGRSPFLDHRLLEWAQQLPAKQLVQGRSKKRLLRAAYRGSLPDEILDRPKHGFGSPVAAWLAGPLRSLLGDNLPNPLLNVAPQMQLLDAHQQKPSGRTSNQLWALLIFSLWAKQWKVTW